MVRLETGIMLCQYIVHHDKCIIQLYFLFTFFISFATKNYSLKLLLSVFLVSIPSDKYDLKKLAR